jgi:hypothetical protein
MSFMRKLARASRLAIAVAGLTGCSSADATEVGTQQESVKPLRTTQVSTVSYTVTGPDGFSASGSFDVQRGEVVGTIPAVPAGGPYTVTLAGASTDGNVTCAGSEPGVTVTCPSTGANDEQFLQLTCTRLHPGHGKTFIVGAEIKLACAEPDGGACVPMTATQACGTNNYNCGSASDGCSGTVLCGTCSAPDSCSGANGGAGVCVCAPLSQGQACGSNACGIVPDGCGGTIDCGACPPNCGTCPAGQVCNGTTCCQPTSSCAPNQCGMMSDGCGGTVDCGACPTGQVCSGTTCCLPATACPSSQTCGTAPNGCSGTIDCGTCPAGQNCLSSGQCSSCAPKTCAAGQCGPMDDGCGGTLVCGGCAAGQICGVDNVCHAVSPACSATGSTTACLSAQGPTGGACLACAQVNGCLDPVQQGGSCEDTTGTHTHFGGTLPDGTTCASVFSQGVDETETQVCLDTLGTIFGSRCAASFAETPCLCGTTDPASCLFGTVTPNGPSYDQYVCDFDSTSVDTINKTDFTNQGFGAGQADALIQCINAFNCPCF